jgi:hypothetical protein
MSAAILAPISGEEPRPLPVEVEFRSDHASNFAGSLRRYEN